MISGHLAKVCAEESIAADEGALQLIARHAEGGVRDALSALDQLGSMPHVTVEAAAQLLGSATGDVLFEFAEALARRDTGAAVSVIARVVEEGRDLRLFTRQILDHLRALFLIRQVGGPEELIDATEEARAQLANQADLFEPARLVHLLRLFVDAQADMRQQAAPRLALELAVVRATVPEADDTAAAALARIERLERLLDVGAGAPDVGTPDPGSRASPASSPKGGAAREGSVEPTPPPRPSATSAPTRRGTKAAAPSKEKNSEKATPQASAKEGPPPGLVDLEKVRRSWPVLLEEVRKISPRLHAFVAEAQPKAFDGRELVLETRFSYHAERLVAEKDAAIIAKAVEAVFGVAPRIKAEVVEGAGGQAEAVAPEAPEDPLDLVRRSLGAEEIEE
jgi:DNA polymerase-3 subunit gamma/tau